MDFDKTNMTRLIEGFYVDADGGLHIDEAEALTAAGFKDTPRNRATLEQAARDMAAEIGATYEEVDH